MDNNDEYVYPNLTLIEPQYDYDKERYKPDSGFSGPSKKDRQKHSQKVKEDMEEVQQTIESKAQDKGIDPCLIFKIEYENSFSEELLERAGFSFLGDIPYDGDEAHVVFSNQERMEQFFEKWGEYCRGELTDSGNPRYRNIFDNIKDIKTLDPSDRKGPKLKEKEINESENYWVDIELWFGSSKTEREDREENLEKVIGSNGCITDYYIGNNIHLLRAKVDGYVLKKLLDLEIVCQIDFPPKLRSKSYEKVTTGLDDLNIGEPDEEASGICIIDSGITPQHNLLENALVDYDVFRKDLEDGRDKSGHGTFVAGIALYNDIKSCIEEGVFIPEVKLFSARVTDENDNLGPSEKLYIKQIKEAIEYYNDNFGCRVFNISLGDPENVFMGNQYQSSWAYILDNLARERDLIITIPSGNINDFYQLGVEKEEISDNYPKYLFKDRAGLLDPATAVNCITVGSISNELRTSTGSGFSGNKGEKSRGVRKISIAELNQPSPFTRTGLGINDTIKPEFVTKGGNMYFDGQVGELICKNSIETGIFSLNFDFVSEGKFFACDSGTSYSTPALANLAARILNFNSDFSSNTIRALLANSTIYPSETYEKVEECMKKVQTKCIEILSEMQDEADEDLKETISEILDKGYINATQKKKLLKSDFCSRNLKELLKVMPGDSGSGCSTEFYKYLLRVGGYGVPDLDRALFSSDRKVTMYKENKIGIDEFQVYEIPIPKDFKGTSGVRKIIISLAYSPPTRKTRQDYCGYSLNFELIRGKDLEEVLKIAGNDTKEERYTELGAERCDDLEPKKSLINNNTLQKAEFVREQSCNEYGDIYYLVIKSEDNWIKDSAGFSENIEEDYSVVVTLEHKKEEVEIYEEIKQYIDSRIEEQAQSEVKEKVRF